MTWADFLSLVRVGGALPMEFALAEPSASGTLRVLVSMSVPHVGSTSTPIARSRPRGAQISIHRVLDLPTWRGIMFAAEWVRDQVLWFYRHEALEQIYVEGVRIFEPTGEH